MPNRTRQFVLFEDNVPKPVHIAFDAESLSSEGGTTLLSQLDHRIGLTRTLLEVLDDRRHQGKVSFTYGELIRQRTYSIALGYEDGIDANTLSRDPMVKLAVGRDPDADPDLASQSTISRFENAPSPRELVEMGRRLEEFVIGRQARRCRKAKVVTLDFDSSGLAVGQHSTLLTFTGNDPANPSESVVVTLTVQGVPDIIRIHVHLLKNNKTNTRLLEALSSPNNLPTSLSL